MTARALDPVNIMRAALLAIGEADLEDGQPEQPAFSWARRVAREAIDLLPSDLPPLHEVSGVFVQQPPELRARMALEVLRAAAVAGPVDVVLVARDRGGRDHVHVLADPWEAVGMMTQLLERAQERYRACRNDLAMVDDDEGGADDGERQQG